MLSLFLTRLAGEFRTHGMQSKKAKLQQEMALDQFFQASPTPKSNKTRKIVINPAGEFPIHGEPSKTGRMQ
jgi:hypothetical protein